VKKRHITRREIEGTLTQHERNKQERIRRVKETRKENQAKHSNWNEACGIDNEDQTRDKKAANGWTVLQWRALRTNC